MKRRPLVGVLMFMACLVIGTISPSCASEAENGVLVGKSRMENADFAASSERLEKLMQSRRKGKSKVSEHVSARAKVMGETAHTLGFQEGLKWQYEKLMASAEARTAEFERIFDFRRLLIDKRVLPPVIRWSGPAMSLESDSYATEVEAQYRIVSPARIVSAPPSWRDYLQMSTEVLEPANEILPSNSEESVIWREKIQEGWNEGVSHARTVFEMSMNRLVSDFRGILRFKMLADRGLVSVPILAQGDLGIQIGENVLNMDQKTFRITVPAEFKGMEK